MNPPLPTGATTLAAVERLRQEVLGRLEKAELRPGDRVLSERKLAGHLGVSYMTARRAVGVLVGEGLLERRPRQGVFVADRARSVGPARKVTGRVRGLFYLDELTESYAQVAAAIGRVLGEAGLEVVWSTVGELVGPDLAERLAGWDEDACVAVGWIPDPVLAHLTGARRPVTIVDHHVDDSDADSVVLDNEGATYDAATRLFDAGHEKVAYVGGQIEPVHPYHEPGARNEWPNSVLRGMGVRRAHLTRDLAVDESLFFCVGHFRGGRELMRRFLAGPENVRPSAAICFDVTIAAGMLVEASERGLRFPDDLAVVAMGTPQDGWRFGPDVMTHYAVNWAEVGAEAGKVCRERLDDREAPRKRVVLPWTRVSRETANLE